MEARLGPVLDELDDGADGPLVILALARAPFMTRSGILRDVTSSLSYTPPAFQPPPQLQPPFALKFALALILLG